VTKRKQSRKTQPRALSLIRERSRQTDELFKTVRQLALEQQKDRPQQFLSLRQAAHQFNVPLSSMAAVYSRLTAEGILSSVRASGTILRGRRSDRTLQVRAVIGIPLSIPLLQTFRAYRECYFSLRKELHARDFVVAPFLLDDLNLEPELIARRSRQEKVDAVIGLRPIGLRHDTALRLRDAAIRFTEINIGGVVVEFCRYEVRRRRAVGLILREWRKTTKITKAIFVRAGEEIAGEPERVKRFRRLAALQEMEFDVVTVPEGRIVRCLQSLCGGRHRGILLAASAGAILGSRARDRINDVLGKGRIAFIDGPTDFPFLEEMPDGVADLVVIDWERVGRRMAEDIHTGEAFRASETIIFEADAHLQVSLRSFLENAEPTARHAA
jgi:hypothetical protein